MAFHVIKDFFYLLICVASVFSNSMLITILIRFEHLRTTSSIFVLNLAVCDMTTVLLAIPFTVAIEESVSYPFGPIGCKVLMPAATAAWNSAAFTLLAIAIERFYVIMFPMKARLHSCKTKCFILCILHGFAVASIIPFSIHQRYFSKSGKEYCLEVWPGSGERIYTLFLFSIQYAIPLSLIVILYSKSWNAIRRQNRIIIKMQEMQQRGACHYSRSQSMEIGMVTSTSQIESAGVVQNSVSNYSFKSTQLEAVDERLQNDSTEENENSENNTLKMSASTFSLKSYQLDSVAANDQFRKTQINMPLEENDQDDEEKCVLGTKNISGESDDEKNEASCNWKTHEEVNGFVGEKEICGFSAARDKDRGGSKLHRFFKCMPFASKKRPKYSVASFSEGDVLLDNEKVNGMKLVGHEGDSMEIKPTVRGMENASQQDELPELKEPAERKTHCIDSLSFCNSTSRKRVQQSTSTSALMASAHDSTSGNAANATLGEQRWMKQSTSSPVLQSSSAYSQEKESKETRSRLLTNFRKMSSSDNETKVSRLSQMAANARRRLSIALGSSNQDSMSVASIKRMKQTRRTLKMFSCVVAVFAVCMLPNQITWIWVAFKGVHLNHIVTTLFYFLTYTNSVINPWIYGAVNPTFRKAYKALFTCRGKTTLRQVTDPQNSAKMSSLRLSRKASDFN